MAELVASRYASALFEAGVELEKIDKFYEELSFIKVVFLDETRLMDILGHPKISKSEKKDLVKNIFGENVSEELINFLYILIDKKREKNLLQILDIYEDLYYDYEGILRVVAVTAMPMKDSAKDRLTDVLAEKLSKKILITNEVDKEVLGGIRLEIEGKLIDGTIQGKLDSMAKLFKAATN